MTRQSHTADVGRSGTDAPSGCQPTDGAVSVSTADAASIPNAVQLLSCKLRKPHTLSVGEVWKCADAMDALYDALEKCRRALCSDSPHGPQKSFGGPGADDTIYHLDGNTVYHALNAARAALAKARGSHD